MLILNFIRDRDHVVNNDTLKIDVMNSVKFLSVICVLYSLLSPMAAQEWEDLTGNVLGDLSEDNIKPLASDGERLFALGKNGVFMSSDNGESFNPINDIEGGTSLSTQTLRFIKYEGGSVWTGGAVAPRMYRLSPGESVWKPSESGIPISDGNPEDITYDPGTGHFFTSFSTGAVRISTDGGDNWSAWTAGLSGIGSPANLAAHDDYIFASRPTRILRTRASENDWESVLDLGFSNTGNMILHEGRIIFSVSRDLHYSDDSGDSWNEISDFSQGAATLHTNGSLIFALAMIGLVPDQIVYSADQGMNWTALSNEGLPGDGYSAMNIFAHGEYLYLIGKKMNNMGQWQSSHLHRLNISAIAPQVELWLGTWEQQPDGWIDAAGWLGWIWKGETPWVYHPDLSGYLFIDEDTFGEEGGWLFVPID